MKHEKFAIWLSGFTDLNMGNVPTKEQWDLITERLAECFDEVQELSVKQQYRSPTYGLFAGQPSDALLRATSVADAISLAASTASAVTNTAKR